MGFADDTSPSITIVHKFTWRGDTNEEWQTTYHFDGATPSSDVRWKALADAIIASEKTIYTSQVKVVRAFGHEPSNKIAVWGYDYENGTGAVSGTLAVPSGTYMPGDIAAWLRWRTAAKTSLGKPIFLRNYYHGVYDNGTALGTSTDQLATPQKTAMEAFGAAWVTGFSDGVATHHRCGPRGAVGSVPQASTNLTTHSLKKRGKRQVA